MMESNNGKRSFNCVDSPWIPVQNYGLVSLRAIFENESLSAIGGTPIQKIALFKLLLAVAQSACTPKDEEEWNHLDIAAFKQKCLSYLDKWHDAFDLYGSQPFLQMPGIAKAKIVSFADLDPQKASGNTTFLTELQISFDISDADKALLLLCQMAFAAAGKKADNRVVLGRNYLGKTNPKGKPASGRYGPGMGIKGYLHSFVEGKNILSTLYLNLATHQAIERMKCFPEGLGTAPWEKMPESENCAVAQILQKSFMGRLLPLNRFCLLTENGMHYSEGILYDNYKDGGFEPTQSIAQKETKKAMEYQTLWADPEKKPWRCLSSLLSFLGTSNTGRWNCPQLQLGLERCRRLEEPATIWSGGQRFSNTCGEQSMGGADDAIQSTFVLMPDDIETDWFARFSLEMNELEQLSKILFQSVKQYFIDIAAPNKSDATRASQKSNERANSFAEKATADFWRNAEAYAQELISACGEYKTDNVRHKFANLLRRTYSAACPLAKPRQLLAWVRHQPNCGRYLKEKQ